LVESGQCPEKLACLWEGFLCVYGTRRTQSVCPSEDYLTCNRQKSSASTGGGWMAVLREFSFLYYNKVTYRPRLLIASMTCLHQKKNLLESVYM
jgi:hypothetical protein